jgi:CBS domain-containing protein
MIAPTKLRERDARREVPVEVAEIMTTDVQTCRVSDTLERAARLMWDHDCGAIPVLDERGHTVAIVTDRDICMAAYTQGKPLWQIPVTVAASHRVHSVHPDASVAVAHQLMKMHRIRRLPVIDRGGNLVGILSIADVIRAARPTLDRSHPLHVEEVASTLAEVHRPSSPTHNPGGGAN